MGSSYQWTQCMSLFEYSCVNQDVFIVDKAGVKKYSWEEGIGVKFTDSFSQKVYK